MSAVAARSGAVKVTRFPLLRLSEPVDAVHVPGPGVTDNVTRSPTPSFVRRRFVGCFASVLWSITGTGGEVAGGDVAGGDVVGGEVAGGDVAGGEVAGGEIAGGDVTGGEVAGGEPAGGDDGRGGHG